jgi:hypothetical protein
MLTGRTQTKDVPGGHETLSFKRLMFAETEIILCTAMCIIPVNVCGYDDRVCDFIH